MKIENEIVKTIQEALPGSLVYILDPMRDGVHLEALVISEDFEGKSLVKQHQMVMRPLTHHFATSLHALGLKTFTPLQWSTVKNQYPEVQ